MTGRDYRDYIRVLLSASYTAITGWGVLLLTSRNSRKLEESSDQLPLVSRESRSRKEHVIYCILWGAMSATMKIHFSSSLANQK